MQLVSLTVLKSTTGEIVREINFNSKGLSLFVDDTNKVTSGSNIGKTTAAKVIDLCLGAKSVSSLYKEKDTGENTVVSEFLNSHKVIATLKCFINGNTYTFTRALYKNGKNEINGKQVPNITEYKARLNEIIFLNKNTKPTLGQLISKFVRLENSNEDALLKFLGSFPGNFIYQAVYEYLFGIDFSKSENVDIISNIENINKDIQAIYRKNSVSSLEEFETKIRLMKDEVEKFKKSYSEFTVIEDYDIKVEENQSLLYDLERYEFIYSKINLQIELMSEKIEKEKEKIFSVDTKLLRRLYDETKLTLEKQLCDFEDLEKFHNEMINKRISVLEAALAELEHNAKSLSDILENIKKKYESSYISFNSELKEKFEEKYSDYVTNKIKLDNYYNDYGYINEKLEEIDTYTSKKVTESKDKDEKDSIVDRFNVYFKELTTNIIGEPFEIVYKEDLEEKEFPIKIVGLNGKPGTGIKKALIACFDLAHIKLIIEKKYHMPTFIVHDKMENIDLKELAGIIKESRKFEGQYIFPILSDRIEAMGIQKNEIVLRLSTKDKFFHI